jgi:DNA-binding transcriptional MerR regulator
MVSQKADSTANRYGIGVVSRLTGVSRDALRVWERRYGVVKAERTDTRRRLYSKDDIKRLMLVKALVDAGHPISSVANLRTTELEERLRTDAAAQPSTQAALYEGTVRVVLIGPSLARLLKSDRVEVDGLEIVATANHLDEVEGRLEGLEADVLVTEHAGLFDETVEEVIDLLERSGARRVIVVYGFASRRAVTAVRKNAPRVIAIRTPVNATELRLACLMDVRSGVSEPAAETTIEEIPARVFTDEELEQIACASTTVQCECPQHLVTLVSNLSAFEAYSEACEHRNAQDAALHAHLHSVAARSRRLIEEALSAVAAADGIMLK